MRIMTKLSDDKDGQYIIEKWPIYQYDKWQRRPIYHWNGYAIRIIDVHFSKSGSAFAGFSLIFDIN
jgi:hypothetical protein